MYRQDVRYAVPVILATFVVVLFVWHCFQWDLVVDDAYISFRYADNLVEGKGLVYNEGERVEGYSNLLWVLVLAFPSWLGLDLPGVAAALGFLVGGFTLWMVYDAGRRVLGFDVPTAFVGCAILAAMGAWTFWVVAGLESGLFGLLLLLLWRTYESASDRPWGPAVLSTLAALLALTRPEGLVAMGGIVAGLVLHRRLPLARVAAGSLPFVVLVGAQLLWRLTYYGQWVPNTYFAKVEGAWASYWRGVVYLKDYLMNENVLFTLPLLLLAIVAAWRRTPLRSLLSVLFAYACFVVYAGGDGLYKYRLAAHVAPLLALALVAGLSRLASWSPRPALVATTLGAVSVLVLLLPTSSSDFFLGLPLETLQAGERRWSDVGDWIDAHTPEDTLIATNVAGRLPYMARRSTLDMLGLCDPVVARTPILTAGSGYAGHERASPVYVIERAPDLIYLSVLDSLPFEYFSHPPSAAGFLARTDLRGYAPLLESQDFIERYAPARIPIGPGAQANVLVRRQSYFVTAPRTGLAVSAWRR